jgi:glycosyltransferase involved in cell wall biosynthesis
MCVSAHAMSKRTRVSIITPVLNRGEFIAEAIESVRSQAGDVEIEHIVVDGGSSDGTLDILRRYPEISWTTGHDDGVYDALNKGIARATGAIIGLLNSDDVLLPGTLAAVLAAFDQPETRMVCCSARMTERGGNSRWRITQEYPAVELANPPRRALLAGPILTNARFYRLETLKALGPFDISYRLIADRKHLLAIYDRGWRFLPIAHMGLEYRSHPGSLTFTTAPQPLLRATSEKLRLAEERLARKDLTRAEREELKSWHRQEVMLGLRLAALAHSREDLLRLGARGFRSSAFWPAAALADLARAAVRRIGRRLRAARRRGWRAPA